MIFPSSASTTPLKDVPSEGQNLSARFISCGASCQISLSFIRSNWLAKDCSNKYNNKMIFSRYRYKTDVGISDFTQPLNQRLTCQRQGNRTASCSLLLCGNIKTSQCRTHVSISIQTTMLTIGHLKTGSQRLSLLVSPISDSDERTIAETLKQLCPGSNATHRYFDCRPRWTRLAFTGQSVISQYKLRLCYMKL